MKFEEFNLDEKIIQGLSDAGYIECMPVQEQTLKETLNKRDAAVQSQTGTGKTAAFLISVLQHFQEDKSSKTLIVVPTRELAVQIEQEAKLLSIHLDINIVSIYGGTGYRSQEDQIANGADIIIGTPGRLIDFGKSGKIKFKEIGTLIIDEADRMFDMGFIPDLRWMMRKMPPKEERLTMLFSATLNSRVKQLAWEYMNDPAEIEITPDSITVDEIDQVLYHVAKNEKMKLLIGILKKEKPETAVIFINTKQKVVEISKRLNYNGFKSSFLMGDMPQKKRQATIDRAKSGDIKLLIATDVAARGLHIDNLEMVFNYDLPEDCENYVHRIGRTARAGKTGRAVSLACEKYVLGLPAIEEYIKMKIPVAWAEEELFAEDASEGIRIHTDRRGPSGHDTGSRRSSGRERNSGGRSRNYQARDSRRSNGSSDYRNNRPGDSARHNDSYKTNDQDNAKSYKPQNNRIHSSEKTSINNRNNSDKTDSFKRDAVNTVNPGISSVRKDSVRKDSVRKDSRRSETAKTADHRKSANKEYSSQKKNNRSYEDRIKYYNEKYGENYKINPETAAADKKSDKSFIKRIKKIFKK